MRLLGRLFVSFVSVWPLTQILIAQNYVKPLTVELSASTGGAFDFPGATAFEGIFCQPNTTNCFQQLKLGKRFLPLVNGEVSIALNKYFWIYGDYTYIFPDHQSATAGYGNLNGNDTVNRHYWSANGGIEVSFPNVHGLVPLLRVGGGEFHNSYNNFDVGPNTRVPIIDTSEARGIKDVTVGGGVRWYLRERQGIRIMANAYYLTHGIFDLVPSSVSNGGVSNVSRRSGGTVTIGYFFQFGH